MNSFRLWYSRLRAAVRRRQLEDEMNEELQFHLAERAEENMAEGLAPDEARQAARRRFGGEEQIKEHCREQGGWIWVEQLVQDVRYAVRSLRRNPGFAAVAVI